MKNKNNQALEYIAINCYGWHRAANPAEAIEGLEKVKGTAKRKCEARESTSLWVRPKAETIEFDTYRPDGNAILLYNNSGNVLVAFNHSESDTVMRPGSVFIIRNHNLKREPIIEGLATLVKPVKGSAWDDHRWIVQFNDDELGEEVERKIDPTDFLPFKG